MANLLITDLANYFQAATWTNLGKPQFFKYNTEVIKKLPTLLILQGSIKGVFSSNDDSLTIYECEMRLILKVRNETDTQKGFTDITELMKDFANNNRTINDPTIDLNNQPSDKKIFESTFDYTITLIKNKGTW